MTSASIAVERPEKPYPGLRPFEAREWSIFFGRERMIDDVIERLARNRLVLIHGASGSGKSSLVRAGIMPKLARQHRRHGTPWLTCAMRPAGGPLWNLATEIARLAGQDDTARIGAIVNAFNRRDVSLAQVVGGIEAFAGKSLCILVDQFEELFRFEKETSREEAELFVDLIVRATREETGTDVHVVVTMRSEFLGQCARFAGLAEVINETQYLVPRMDDEALLRAVRRPAQMFKGLVGEDLAYRLISRVRGREDELPLLQHALMLMWDEAAARPAPDGRVVLDGTMVEAAGGLAELLSEHADRVMASIAPDAARARIVESVFRELTDVNAEGAAIRRPRTAADLAAVAGTSVDALRPMLDAFRAPGVSFLTPYAPAPIGEASIIDISHEALIRCWRRLGSGQEGWLKQELDDGLAWRSLAAEAEAFERNTARVLSPAATKDRGDLVAARNEAWSRRYGGGWPLVGKLLEASRRSAARARRLSRIAIAALSITAIGTATLAYVSSLEWRTSEKERGQMLQENQTSYMLFESTERFMKPNANEKIAAQSLFKKTKFAADQGNVAEQEVLGLLYSEGIGTPIDFKRAFQTFEKAADAGYAPAFRSLGYLYASGHGVPQNYKAAFAWYEKAADAGDPSAMGNIGALYQNGQGVPRDVAKARSWYERAAAAGNIKVITSIGETYEHDYAAARQWFQRAAEAGDASALDHIGLLYEKGWGIPQDYATALDWYKQAADAGDAWGMRNIGVFYEFGRSVPKSYAIAREWFQKAADAGDTNALVKVGFLYEKGWGVQQDYATASDWYKKAADAGDALGMLNTGVLYEHGRGVPKNYDTARQWFQRAAEAGDTRALIDIALLYENGWGVPQDYAKEREWYEKAAAAGDAIAMNDLGILYEQGRGVPQNYSKALEWLKKSVASGNTPALTGIGYLYAKGWGVPQDDAEARECYQKAAAAGDGVAMRNLGNLYDRGQGVARDPAKAQEWWEKAAAAGDSYAANFVAARYYLGRGVARDYAKAREWFEVSAAGGNPAAMYALGSLYSDGSCVPRDDGKAREWWERAAAIGDRDAMYSLGIVYYNGQGITQDRIKARDWWEKAAVAGSTDAMFQLGVAYEQGLVGSPDYGKARAWFEKAAAAGTTAAVFDLGNLYANGEGGPTDYAKARALYEQAADAGWSAAMINLGGLYERGQGGLRSYAKAREWYEKAAKDPVALVKIGLLYARGLGVPQDDARARQYFEKAAAAGSGFAMDKLAGLYVEGQGVPQDYAQARGWYEKALAAGWERAALGVGWTSLILRDFSRALSVSLQAHDAAIASLDPETNRAHALMFLGRTEEARAIYLAHRGATMSQTDRRTWQQVILDDFAALRKAGLDNPLMTEIEADFAAHKT